MVERKRDCNRKAGKRWRAETWYEDRFIQSYKKTGCVFFGCTIKQKSASPHTTDNILQRQAYLFQKGVTMMFFRKAIRCSRYFHTLGCIPVPNACCKICACFPRCMYKFFHDIPISNACLLSFHLHELLWDQQYVLHRFGIFGQLSGIFWPHFGLDRRGALCRGKRMELANRNRERDLIILSILPGTALPWHVSPDLLFRHESHRMVALASSAPWRRGPQTST